MRVALEVGVDSGDRSRALDGRAPRDQQEVRHGLRGNFHGREGTGAHRVVCEHRVLCEQLQMLPPHGEMRRVKQRPSDEIRAELLSMSVATIDRYLKHTSDTRRKRNGKSTTKPGNMLRESTHVRPASTRSIIREILSPHQELICSATMKTKAPANHDQELRGHIYLRHPLKFRGPRDVRHHNVDASTITEVDEVKEYRSITDHPFRRPVSARRLLNVAWSGEPLTATEFMEKTGFTRATVLSACRELVEAGWFNKEADARTAGEYTKGRPALRHTFRPDAAFVVAGDADEDFFTVAVADLHGVERSRVALKVSSLRQAAERRRTLKLLVEEALEAANVPAERVAAVTLGVPAPVDPKGSSPPPDGREHYWPTVNPDFASLFHDMGWTVRLDNDANLGALCESTDGAGVGVRSFATLLSTERFGAGIVVDGRLLRGTRGAVGEMRILDMVMGVEAPHGIERRARWELRHLDEKGKLAGELANLPSERRDALAVFRAAERNDPTALEVVDTLAERLARVVRLLSGLLDLDRIIIAGAIAPSVGPLLQRTREILERDPTQRWAELVASEYGADIVLRGAISSAIVDVRKRALQEPDEEIFSAEGT